MSSSMCESRSVFKKNVQQEHTIVTLQFTAEIMNVSIKILSLLVNRDSYRIYLKILAHPVCKM